MPKGWLCWCFISIFDDLIASIYLSKIHQQFFVCFFLWRAGVYLQWWRSGGPWRVWPWDGSVWLYAGLHRAAVWRVWGRSLHQRHHRLPALRMWLLRCWRLQLWQVRGIVGKMHSYVSCYRSCLDSADLQNRQQKQQKHFLLLFLDIYIFHE